jgi:glycerol-3-phosphate dehydrogenase
MSASSRFPVARPQLLAALRGSDPWDLIVIGGGATGLGTAVDAAARGYRTLLLESDDFAKGTSSRATKLVHGGVRYLAQGNIHLVREALRERGLLLRNAPHLVHDLGFLIPAYTWWSKPFYGIGLTMYDLLAGRLGFGRCRALGAAGALAETPTLRQKGLRGGILYHDGQFDDARLAVTLLRTLFDLGGAAVNYLPVTGLTKSNGKISGVIAGDIEGGEEFQLRAKAVVNATGVFVDAVRRMDDPATPAMLSPSQGIHLVVDRRFQPGRAAVMIPKTDDGRVLFAVPWHGKVVIGTTDTPVDHISREPRPLEEEIEFVLRTAARYLEHPPGRKDVLSVFVGQRPLVKAASTDGAGSTAAISRDHVVRISRAGLITITGGKWTTYRKMGEDAVDQAIKIGSLDRRPTRTPDLRLHGWSQNGNGAFADVYGTDAEEIGKLPGAQRKLHPALEITEAQVRWAVREELARTVEDVLSRRSRALLLDARASIAAAPEVAEIIAAELGSDDKWSQNQVDAYRKLASGYLLG